MTRPDRGGTRVEQGSPGYPPVLPRLLGPDAPAALSVIGDPGLLTAKLTALFCSVRVPPELVLPTYDLARALREAGVAVIGGFQSPLEQECLEYLLRGHGPVVVSPARGIERMRMSRPWREAVDQGRLLIVSRFQTVRRPSDTLAIRRNRLVAALAERVCLAHASPGGRLQRLAEEALAWGKPVACLAHPANGDLMLMGASAIEPIRLDRRGPSAASGVSPGHPRLARGAATP